MKKNIKNRKIGVELRIFGVQLRFFGVSILAILLLAAGYFAFLQKPETAAADWCNCEGAKVSFQRGLRI